MLKYNVPEKENKAKEVKKKTVRRKKVKPEQPVKEVE
jgi:hypothetical protein